MGIRELARRLGRLEKKSNPNRVQLLVVSAEEWEAMTEGERQRATEAYSHVIVSAIQPPNSVDKP